ncbi:MAG: hypothetical protein JXR10_08670 [Cyclobacteriaceae bacterium]
MKKLLIITAIIFTGFMAQAEGPEYASGKTEEIVAKMIDAHGGYEKWSNLKTMQFTTTMHSPSLGFLRFWINDQMIDMQSRRTYQDWPLVGSKLAYNGEEIWSIDWRVGNPPSHQKSVFFYYLNLPWLTQEDFVNLSEPELIKHPGFDNEVHKIVMSYSESPTPGKSQKDTYTLYIDSKSYLLVGYEYTVGYGPMLDVMGMPAETEVFGPMLRKNNYFADINGLKFPLLFTTHDAQLTTQYGDHAIYDLKFNEKFDESRMIKPDNAVVDPAMDVRK